MKINIRQIFGIALIAVIVSFAACNKTANKTNTNANGGPSTPDSVSLKNNIVVIDSTKLTLISSADQLSQGIYVYTYTGATPGFVVNGVIIGITGDGYLRKITSITNSPGQVVLNTVQGDFTDVFQNGKISFSSGFSNLMRKTDDGYTYNISNVALYDRGGVSVELTNGSVKLNPNWNYSMEFNDGDLASFSALCQNGTLNSNFDVNVAVSTTASFDKSDTIATGSRRDVVWVGQLPIVIVTYFYLIANVSGNINANINRDVVFTDNESFNLGVNYFGGSWSGVHNFNHDATTSLTGRTGAAGFVLNCSLIPQMNIKLFGILGPYGSLPIKTYMVGNIASPALDWDFSMGEFLQPTIGVSANILSKKLADYSTSWNSDSIKYYTPYQISVISGNNQTGSANSYLAQPLKVQVTDNLGKKQSNVPVYFTVTNGGGSAESTSILTDTNGYAQTRFKLGSNPSAPQWVHASAKKANGTAINGSPAGFVASISGSTGTGLTTNTVTSITSASAVSGGNIPASLGTITARGVCWGTAHNPTIAGNHTSDGASTGIFTSNITGLSANTTYYVRAYATNSVGISYGNEQTFHTTTTAFGYHLYEVTAMLTGPFGCLGDSMTLNIDEYIRYSDSGFFYAPTSPTPHFPSRLHSDYYNLTLSNIHVHPDPDSVIYPVTNGLNVFMPISYGTYLYYPFYGYVEIIDTSGFIWPSIEVGIGNTNWESSTITDFTANRAFVQIYGTGGACPMYYYSDSLYHNVTLTQIY